MNNMRQMTLPLSTKFPNTEKTVIRSGIRFYTQFCNKIPSPIVSEYFSVYKLLYWSAKHTYYRIVEGMIESEGIQYQVIYKGITRGQLLSLIQNEFSLEQISLSFRKPNPEWNIQPTVILNCAGVA